MNARSHLFAAAMAWLAFTPGLRGDVVFESLPAGPDTIGMGQPTSIAGAAIVGSAWSVSKWEGQAFRWTRSNGVQFLESSLPLASRANGGSSDGLVVGGQRFADYPVAFCWNNGTLKPLSANRNSTINDISKSGALAVGSNPATYTASPLAAKWTVSGAGTAAAVSLGDLSGGTTESEATRVSGDGNTIVGWGTSASGVAAFRVVGTGAMASLGDLPGGRYFSEASAVSTNGGVVVGRSDSANGPEAFRWTSAGGMAGLGDLNGGLFSSSATGVSGDGTLVVGTGASATGVEVFVWDAVHGMRGLAALCRMAEVDIDGWRFTYSRPAISEDGNVLTGDAISPNEDQVVWRLDGLRELAAQASTLFWDGDSAGNVWDLGVTMDWTDGSAPVAFANGNRAVFDDLGSNVPPVNLTGTLAPADVLVDADKDYTFGGSGSLTGAMSLVKRGTGTLTITGSHSFSGGVTVESGMLVLSGTITDTGGIGIHVLGGATLRLLGGTIAGNVYVHAGGFLTGSGRILGNLTNDGTVEADSGGQILVTGTVVNNGTLRLGSGARMVMTGSVTNNGVFDLLAGASSLPASMINNGVLLDSSSLRVDALVKTGPSVRLTIQSVLGHQYQLQRSTTLGAQSWTNLGAPKDGTGSSLEFVDPAAAGHMAFYRIAVVK